MIISDKNNQPSRWALLGRYAVGTALLLVLLYFILSFFFPYWGASKEGVIFCDAEFIRGDVFVSQGYTFKNSQTQSNEQSYQGNFSSKTNRNEPTGMKYILRTPTPNDRYRVTVYRYRGGATGGELIVKGEKDSGFEKRVDLASSKNDDGWELLELSFNVPEKGNGVITISVFSNSNTPVYFDNLKIEKLTETSNELNIEPFKASTFRLEIAEQYMQQIREKRSGALNSGVLLSDDDDWVNAKIDDGAQKLNIDIRLKGNRLYHLQGSKWSYKVRVDSFYAWNGMRTFSIHNPASKNFLREWIYHELLRKEGVIASRYDYFQLRLNNRNRGIYAFEENPDEQLAAYHKRPNSVVVRFSEDAFWYNVKRQVDEFGQQIGQGQYINDLNASVVEPFKSGQILENPELQKHFQVAQSLMHQYKYNLKPAKQIFDIDLMAKYFAIMDVMQAYQGLDWHDQRYYFNPATSKLEPVGMSGFGIEAKSYRKRPFVGQGLFNPDAQDYNIYMHLFLDKAFVTKYCQYLHDFSKKSYIESFLLDVEKEALRRQQFIRKEFKDYAYDASAIIKNAKNIRAHLIPEDNISLRAKRKGNIIKVTNYHGLPLQIIGFGKTKTEMSTTLKSSPILQTNLAGLPPKYVDIQVPSSATYVFYQLPGINQVFHSAISYWNAPEASVPAQDLFDNANIATNEIYEVRGNLIAFKKGKYSIGRDIIIPEGYQVNIPGGTELSFGSGAKFLSKSPVMTFGKSGKPVVFRSTNGILLLDVQENSTFRNTYFIQSSNLNYNNWWLPGGVTVYNSKVTFDNCTFSYSKAPESLSLMRSEFELIDCNFNNNEKKGLVSLYSNGNIQRTRFLNNTLIGVELLGSKVEIDDVVIQQAANNGLIVGDDSKVNVKYIEIKDTDIGVVSKDMSRLTIEKISLENCKRGFAAYQKKPEFGGSRIVVNDYNAKAVKVLHRIELGSTLKIKGKEVRGY